MTAKLVFDKKQKVNFGQSKKYINLLLYFPENINSPCFNNCFLSETKRIIGKIDTKVEIFYSYVKDIPDSLITDSAFEDIQELIDAILIVSEYVQNLSTLLQFAKKVNKPIIFTSIPTKEILDECQVLDVSYEIFKSIRSEFTEIPTINIYGINKNQETPACIKLSLRIANEFTQLGYSVGYNTEVEYLKFANNDAEPNIIINLLSACGNENDITFYVADFFEENLEKINNFTKEKTKTHHKKIVIHQNRNREICENIYYLNFYDSNLGELLSFIKNHLALFEVSTYIDFSNKIYLKNSKSIHLYDFNKKYYIYFSALRQPLFLTKKEYLIAKKIYSADFTKFNLEEKETNKKNVCDFLMKINRLIYKNYIEEEIILFRLSLNPSFIDKNTYTISFVGNGACNMNCKYCFSDHSDTQFKGKNLPVDVMNKALELISNQLPRPSLICVDFMIGSEPLTQFDDYIRLIEVCRFYKQNKNIKIQVGFLTNGTLLTKDIIDLFNNDLRWMGFSLDGDKKTHDNMRILRNRKGTYDIIKKNAQMVLSLNWEYTPGVSTVITSFNMDVLQIFKHLWNIGFRVIISRPVRACKEQSYSINSQNVHLLEKGYTRLANFLIKKVKRHQLEYLKAILFDTDYFGRFLIRTFYNTRILVKHCGAGESILSIRNDGSIYSCDSLNAIGISKVGDVINGIKSRYVLEYVTEIEMCKACYVKFACGGICNHLKYIDKDGDIMNTECRITKFLIKLSVEFWEKAFKYLTKEEKESILSYISTVNGMQEKIEDIDNFAYGPR